MTKLYLDFETASVLDLKLVGLDNYAKHPSTHVLMCAYAFDDGPVQLWEPNSHVKFWEALPFLGEKSITHVAWNAQFERHILQHVLKIWIPYEQWLDPMVWARHLSLPGSLEAAGNAIGLPFDLAKKNEGKRLIKKFSMPYHKGGEETLFGISEPQFHNWEDEPQDWALFGDYCKQDVIAERAILKLCSNIPLPESEQQGWILDQKINDRGIPVNRKFAQNALALSIESKKRLTAELKTITGLANPNSQPQFLGWAAQQGYPHTSLGKNFVKAALDDSAITPLCRRAIKLRQETAKISYMKYEALLNRLSDDDRFRHGFAFMGAARTGRWSGKGSGDAKKGFQPQNLPRPDKEIEKHYDRALELIMLGDYELAASEIKTWFDPQPEFPSIIGMTTSCLRSVFQAPPGKKLVVCDLSAIENRVIGWLADCDAVLQVFVKGRDPYLDFAARMYGIPYEKLYADYKGKNGPEAQARAKEMRQIAKPAVLGAGYGLGPGASRNCSVCDKDIDRKTRRCGDHLNAAFTYKAVTENDGKGNIVLGGLMGYAKNMGVTLTAEQSYLAWETFRDAYPEIVSLWKKYEKAAVKVLKTGQTVKAGKFIFQRRSRKDGTFILRMILPPGRGLHYMNARVETEVARRQSDGEEYERDKLFYDGVGHGVGQILKGQKWGKTYTYGGKITENGDQGFSRDVFLHGMTMADEIGMSLVFHAHDEAVCEEDDDPFAPGLSDLRFCMEQVPEYAPGLLLAAEGWEGQVYRKG